MKNITGVQEFREVELKLPPIQEQKRIVEKIEELFSVLEAGVVSLRNIENQLKAYRRSVLKWAFEGKLTETWRSRCERAGSLARVQLLTGQKKKKNSAGATPNEGLPGTKVCGVTGWLQVRLIDVVETIFDGPFGSHLKTEDYCATGVRVIRLENIQHLNFDESKKTFISEHKYEGLKKHTVSGGDIIFSSFVNEEVRCCILPSLESAAIAKADCFCIRIGSNPINKQWLCYFLCSSDTYQQLSHQIHGFTRPRVNTSQIKVLSVPLCSEAEQVEIVREIEKRLAECDQLEALIQMELIRAEALRQSILKRAFSGRLVPQNTADGSASDLLARIANERLARVSKIVGDKTMRQKKSKSKKLIEV
jgi:type I restriction enzyme S subunit